MGSAARLLDRRTLLIDEARVEPRIELEGASERFNRVRVLAEHQVRVAQQVERVGPIGSLVGDVSKNLGN